MNEQQPSSLEDMGISPNNLGIVITLLLFQLHCISAVFLLDDQPGGNTVQFSIKFRRNETDHRVMQFHLKETNGPALKNWKGDLIHTRIEKQGIHTNYVVGTLTVPPQRSLGYELIPGIGYYKFHSTKTDFVNASNVCQNEGAHLAIINSEEEAAALAKQFGSENAWIGVHDPNKNRDFRTIFGTPLNNTGFSRWPSGQPNGPGTQFCVLLDKKGFNDYQCEEKFKFICEHDLSWDDY